MAQQNNRFWQTKALNEMSAQEWEALCDGCGRCCLIKLEDEDSAEIFTTRIACKLLDLGTCRCQDYANRQNRVADCLKLTLENATGLTWLPDTCAYRVLAQGGNLAWWHPLVSGDPQTVITAGISVKNKTVAEDDIDEEDYPDYIVGSDLE